ncbi:hypothetical protein JW926_01420 [Candidatus Sumerlaeota bacterium]|nr:hypothetical protein [Candidatus Sumerlaeota bacterium]
MKIFYVLNMVVVSFMFILLIDSGNCVVTQEEIDQIKNEAKSLYTRETAFFKIYKIVKENDENDLKIIRDLVNEMLRSDDMATRSNALIFCSRYQDKLNNSEEFTRSFIDFIKDERYTQHLCGVVEFMSVLRFTESDIRELLEIFPSIEKRLGGPHSKLYLGVIASNGGEKAYDILIKHYNLDNATTETLLKYDWLLIKTGDMRSIKRVLPMVESMPLETCSYTRELEGVIGAIMKRVRKEKTDENMRLYTRCQKLMNKITSNESSHPEYIQRICMFYSGLLLNTEDREFGLQKLEETRPLWKDRSYAKHIEYAINKLEKESYGNH